MTSLFAIRRSSLLRAARACAWGGVLAVAALAAQAAPVALAPMYGPTATTGGGADASFIQIDPQWHGSTVLWNESTRRYGNGTPGNGYAVIGSTPWGSGLWGRADWQAIQSGAADGAVTARWDGISGAINYGNGCYNTNHSATWGAAQPVPVPDNGDCADDLNGNWTAHFEGYLRITDAGLYNFSVLYDDGFFLRLTGAEGVSLEIGRDFLNPRDRLGFDNDLALLPGLYAFELGAWNRLQAGVVDLRMSRDGGDTWVLVPPENLVPRSAIPLPGTLALLLSGALAAWGTVRRRRP